MSDLDQLLSAWKQSVELNAFEAERIEREIVEKVLEPSSPQWWKTVFAGIGDGFRVSNELNRQLLTGATL